MRIMTLNCWGGRIHGPFTDFLQSVDADVYCLQEVFDMPARHGFFSDETDSENFHRPKVCSYLFEMIGALLPNHRGFMHHACRWELADREDNRKVPCYFGIATFVRKKIPIFGHRADFVFEEYRNIPQIEKPTPRIMHALRVCDPHTGRPLVVAHMHGLWIPEGKHSTPERMRQAALFGQYISDLTREGDGVVACGDFNILPDDPSFDLWKATNNLHDLIGPAFSGTRTHYYYNDPKKKGLPLFADYMLVSPQVRVEKVDVLYNDVVSDHCPITLEF